jgi:hypothetical protein
VKHIMGLAWWIVGLLILFFGKRFPGTVILLQACLVMAFDDVLTAWSTADTFTPHSVTALFIPFLLSVYALCSAIMTSHTLRGIFQGCVTSWLVVVAVLAVFPYFPTECQVRRVCAYRCVCVFCWGGWGGGVRVGWFLSACISA